MAFESELFSGLLKDKGISNESLVEILDKKYGIESTVATVKSYRLKKGKNRTPQVDKLRAFSEILGVSMDTLVGLKATITGVKTVPIIGTASCGALDLSICDDSESFAYFNDEFWKPSLYAIRACGDSMSPEIDNGDICIVDRDTSVTKPQSGDLVLYKIDNEYAIKVFVEDKEAYVLQFIPYNSSDEFKTRTIRLDDYDTLGRLTIHKVIGVNKTVSNRAGRLKMVKR